MKNIIKVIAMLKTVKRKVNKFLKVSDNISDDDNYLYNLYSPIAVNFPNKVKNGSRSDYKGIIPGLDLSKTKNRNYTLDNKIN